MIYLQPEFDEVGGQRAAALPGLHSVTGINTAGSISGTGKKKALIAIMKVPLLVIEAQISFGCEDMPPQTSSTACF